LCSSLQPPATSSLLRPNIPLRTLFSNTLNLCSSLNVRHQVSHQYKQQAKYSSVYFNLYILKQSAESQ
jgi:polysaccharide pyruvyl transferase WcaK-like protein